LNRRAFARELTRAGCVLHRHGKKHDLYLNPANGRKAPVPRHPQILESLCELIRRQLGLV
jgi:mRNA interferase HicA